MAELTIKIKGDSASAQAALKKAGVSFEKLNKKAKPSVLTMNQFKAGAIAAAAAIAGVIAITKKLVTAAAEQEKQERTLAAAMQQAGTFTQRAFEHNLKYASSLQVLTTFGDEAIITVQKMLTNFGVEGEMLDKLTKSTLDLASAKGMDLRAAADLVAKSVGSSTNALTRYGIEVSGSAGSTERMQTAVENITKIFGGAAAAEADTFSGQIKQMNNNIGDLMESLGELIVPLLRPMVKAMKAISKSIEGFVDNIKDFSKTVAGIRTMATAVFMFKLGLELATFALQKMADLGMAMVRILVNSFKGLGEVVRSVFTGDLKGAIAEFGTTMVENQKMFAEGFVKGFGDIGTIVSDFYTKWTEAEDQNKENIIENGGVIKKTMKETFKEGTKSAVEWAEKNKDIMQSYLNTFSSISTGLVSIEKNKFDRIDKEDSAARSKQAKRIRGMMIFEKATKMAGGGIDAAAAVLKTMASVPYPFNIPLAIAQGIAGGIQLAAIASTPIPSVADIAAPHGADFTTDGPTTMTVGDNPSGRERVTVTPEEEGGGGENVFYIDNVNIYTDSPEDFGEQMKELGIRTARRA